MMKQMRINMKRILALAAAAVMCLGLVTGLTGCSSRQKIYVFNCGDYIAPEIIDEFEEAYPQYQIIYDTFDTNETMYQKLVSTNIPYDVIVPSDYMVERLIKEERLLKIDMDRITNYSKIRESLKNMAFDPDNEYSVPYMWGTLGIVYNTKLVDEEVDSWDILWDSKYKGSILMLDSVRDTMGLSLARLGYDMNTVVPEEVEAAGKELEKQKELVKQYGVDDIKAPMINGHYALCVEYSGDALWMIGQNEDLEYAIPKEGSNVWIDSMCIPTSSKNYDGAIAFIDFMCSTEIAAENAEYIEYSTPQTEALELLGEEYIENHVFNPSDEELAVCDSFLDLGEGVDLYNKAWEKLRLSSGEDDEGSISYLLWVYLGLIAVIIVLVVIFKIKKAKQDKFRYGS